jgi:acetyl-CoA carboxylase carboxyltransferase component
MEGQDMSTISKARQRIQTLLDDNSFVEIGAGVTARATDFNMKPTETPSDGVITGYGVMNDRLVYVYSQDSTVLNGTIGEMHAKKIANLYDLAQKTGAPIIGLLDSAGLRLQESTDALNAFGTIYQKQADASGCIPQITAIFGNCGGGLALFAGLTDFTFMEGEHAKLFVNAPNALAGNTIAKQNTQTAAFQAKESGLVDLADTEEAVLASIKELVDYLPSNFDDDDTICECTDDLNRVNPEVEGFVGDTGLALSLLADDESFLELKPEYAKEMVTGFLRLNGMTVGAVANRAEILDEEGNVKEKLDEGALSCAGCEKAADFVNFCDAFGIPVLSLTNVKGYEATVASEKGIAKAAAKLSYAFASANVPKVNVIVGKAFGTAYTVMNSKAIGADMTFAWPKAQIGTMEANLAAKIMFEGKGAEVIEDKAMEYAALQNNVQSALARGYVDSVIEAGETRKNLIAAFEMLYSKKVSRPEKKHGAV